jgi:hypothetical protein
MPTSPPAPAKRRLLVVSHTTGFRHDSIPVAEETFRALSEQSGAYDVSYCRTAEDVRSMLTAEGLKGIHAVAFANTTGDLGIPDLGAFLGWIKKGGAFIGTHSASDTYRPDQAKGETRFIEMIGGEFARHGSQCEVELRVDDGRHPAVRGFPKGHKVFDEIYLFKDNDTKPVRQRAKILLSLDRHPNDGSPDAGKAGDYPISWCKPYGKGRVFYSALGHRDDVWRSDVFRRHLLNGIRWAMKITR